MSGGERQPTIVLLQTTKDRSSRTFLDFNSVPDALNGVCGMYEKLLQDLNPGLPTLTYDVADLFGFLDSLSELSMLVWDRGTGTYLPRDRAWIKSATQRQLQSIATGKPR